MSNVKTQDGADPARRRLLTHSVVALAAGAALTNQAAWAQAAQPATPTPAGSRPGPLESQNQSRPDYVKPYVKTRDGTNLYVKDWGSGRPVVLIHGWPLDADMFDRTAMRLAAEGFRVINYDRRGMGRSNQPYEGYTWDVLSDDLADVMAATGADHDVSIIGYSMGGGEVARYMHRHAGKGVVKCGLLASIAPGMLKSADNPHGNPPAGYDGIAAGITADPAKFYAETFLPPFYGVGGPHRASQNLIDAAVTTALMMGMKPAVAMAHAFSFGDFVQDMPSITVPTLILHGTADPDVPIAATAERAAKMIKQAKLIEYEGHPHAFYATNGEQMDQDLLAFLKS